LSGFASIGCGPLCARSEEDETLQISLVYALQHGMNWGEASKTKSKGAPKSKAVVSSDSEDDVLIKKAKLPRGKKAAAKTSVGSKDRC